MTLLSPARDGADIGRPALAAAEALPAELARLTAERDAALAEVTALRARLDHEASVASTTIDRLTREMRDARRLVVRSEPYRADRGTLERIGGLLGSGLSSAAQNGGLEVLQGNLGRAIAAWQAEVAAERAELQARLEAAQMQRAAAPAGSGRIAGPVRRLRRAAGVIRRGSRGPTPSPSMSPPRPDIGAEPSRLSAQARLDAMVQRIETEMSLVGKLLRSLSTVLGLRTGAETVEPGSELYRALPLEGQLAAWIRFDAARQRRTHA